jgi:DNA-directed RNA polymerase specialized sigma subunit
MIIKTTSGPRRCANKNKSNNAQTKGDIREDEFCLIQQYVQTKNITLIAQIVKNNLQHLNLLARKYVQLAVNEILFKDLVGVGVLTLIKVLNSCKPSDELDFAATADRHVRCAMIKEVHLFNSTRVPRNIWQALSKITFLNVCDKCNRRCIY